MEKHGASDPSEIEESKDESRDAYIDYTGSEFFPSRTCAAIRDLEDDERFEELLDLNQSVKNLTLASIPSTSALPDTEKLAVNLSKL